MKLRLAAALLLSATALTLTGCIDTSAPAAPMAATDIYLDYNVISGLYIQPEIADFAANGCCAPTILSDTPSSVGITAVATDTSGNIYAALFDFYAQEAEIDVFAGGSAAVNGSVAPTRTFHNGFMTAPVGGLTVDPSGNVYVYDYNQNLFKFTPVADGIAQPLFMLNGLIADNGMTTDSKGNFYISATGAGPAPPCPGPGSCPTGINGDAIYVYSAGFDNLTPENIITPPDSEFIDGLAVDASGNIHASGELTYGTYSGQIETYAPTATGNATPTSTITGANTLLSTGSYNTMTIDAVGTLYVRSLSYYGPGGTSTINEFPSTASGNVAPAVSINAGLPLYYPNVSIAVASYAPTRR
ncbi:MAG TPA: hypothetical protein VNU94_05105 [Acidobacteriaceae bacterium]|nr:hypothetical protein [Acidobacteriaceae bacterium]